VSLFSGSRANAAGAPQDSEWAQKLSTSFNTCSERFVRKRWYVLFKAGLMLLLLE
jgi:hypothetical protein